MNKIDTSFNSVKFTYFLCATNNLGEYIMTRTIVLEIPEEILDAVKIPPDEIEEEMRKELALSFYKRGVISSSIAARLAGKTRWEFEDLLARYKIPRHYSETEIEEDIKYGAGH